MAEYYRAICHGYGCGCGGRLVLEPSMDYREEEIMLRELEGIKQLESRDTQLKGARATIKTLQEQLEKSKDRIARLELVLKAVGNTVWNVNA